MALTSDGLLAQHAGSFLLETACQTGEPSACFELGYGLQRKRTAGEPPDAQAAQRLYDQACRANENRCDPSFVSSSTLERFPKTSVCEWKSASVPRRFEVQFDMGQPDTQYLRQGADAKVELLLASAAAGTSPVFWLRVPVGKSYVMARVADLLPLSFRKPKQLSSFAALDDDFNFEKLRLTREGVSFAVESAKEHWSRQHHFTVAASCEQLGLELPDYQDPWDALGVTDSSMPDVEVNGAVFAHADLTHSLGTYSGVATLVAAQGSRARVKIDAGDVHFLAWTKLSVVAPQKSYRVGHGSGGGRSVYGVNPDELRGYDLRCQRDVPIVMQIGSGYVAVGKLAAGDAAAILKEQSGRLLRIAIGPFGGRPEIGVLHRELADCIFEDKEF